MSGSIEQGATPWDHAHPHGSEQGTELGPAASMAWQGNGGAGIGAEMWVWGVHQKTGLKIGSPWHRFNVHPEKTWVSRADLMNGTPGVGWGGCPKCCWLGPLRSDTGCRMWNRFLTARRIPSRVDFYVSGATLTTAHLLYLFHEQIPRWLYCFRPFIFYVHLMTWLGTKFPMGGAESSWIWFCGKLNSCKCRTVHWGVSKWSTDNTVQIRLGKG